MPDLPLPVEFRQEIIEDILNLLRQGLSCSLIGVGSSGKSNVVRHIDRADVRQHYLGDYAKHVLNLYVNCAELTQTPYTAHGLYRLILEVMTKAVKDAQDNVAAQHPKLRDLWKETLDSESDALARSNLKNAFDVVFQAGVKQVFISLDDCDSFFTEAPAPAVNSLRALRDDYKVKIAFVTVTRRELAYLRDPNEVEDFFELVVPGTTFAVGPYLEEDARFMIKRLASREDSLRTFSEDDQARMLKLSGCHPGLLRMIYIVVTQHQTSMISDSLRTAPAIVEECEKIWVSLEENELCDLESVISIGQPVGQGHSALLDKGVISVRRDGVYHVFSPLFSDFAIDHLRQHLPVKLLSRGRVKISDRDIVELSGIEYLLLKCLINYYPEPVTWGKLLEEMQMAEVGQLQPTGRPGLRLEEYLDNIKRKIKDGDHECIQLLPDGRYRLTGLVC